MLPRIQPIAPKRIQAPFEHNEFVFELKMDGWRCMAYIEDGKCRLVSRKQNQFKSFGTLNAALAKLPVPNAIIDGEVVCLDAKGRSVFLDIRRRKPTRFSIASICSGSMTKTCGTYLWWSAN